MSTQPLVPMYAPDGTLGQVPYEQAMAAVKAGGKVAVKMTAPDGTHGYVPADRTSDAQKAGGKIVPINSEEAQHPGYLETLKNIFSSDGNGPTSSDTGNSYAEALTRGMSGQAQQSIGVGEQASEQNTAQIQSGKPAYYRGASLAASVAGLPINPTAMEQSAEKGDTAAVAAQATPAAALAVAPLVGEGVAKAGGALAAGVNDARVGAFRTPEGAPTPFADAVMHPTKLPEYTFNKVFPESPETIAARNDFLQAKTITEAQEKAIAINAVKDARAARAAGQAAKTATKPSHFPADATSSAAPVGNAQLPKTNGVPQGSPTPFVGKFTQPGETTPVSALAGSPDDLITRTQRLVVPGETPTVADLKRAGDLTQAPLSRLQQLAKFGDRLAQNEIYRRLKNP